MNPQQRAAAIGTDKELSDLLDFSAVGYALHFFVLFPLYVSRTSKAGVAQLQVVLMNHCETSEL